MPSVETHTERVAAQHTKDFSERGFQPSGITIVGDFSTVTRAIVCEVRRIGQREINAATAQLPHDFDAIALQGCIRLRLAGGLFALLYIHFSSLFRVGFASLHAKTEGTNSGTERTVCGGAAGLGRSGWQRE